MGYGLGAALGAKTGMPDKTVVNIAFRSHRFCQLHKIYGVIEYSCRISLSIEQIIISIAAPNEGAMIYIRKVRNEYEQSVQFFGRAGCFAGRGIERGR